MIEEKWAQQEERGAFCYFPGATGCALEAKAQCEAKA